MQTKTTPQYWFQLPAKSTEELTQIWESGVAVDDPEIDLELVEQVLMARHVIEPTSAFMEVPQVGFQEKPVIRSFSVSQMISPKMTRRWDVTLNQDYALFSARDGNERFTIDRQKGRPEFQFQRSGFLFLSEGTSALLRGKTFEFGWNKADLSNWFPVHSPADLRKEQTIWGVGMVLIGALSLLLNVSLVPLLGSILILLGVMNFILHNQGIWVVNGLGLLVNGAFMLGSSAFTRLYWQSSNLTVTLFWVALGLFQVILGFRLPVSTIDFKFQFSVKRQL